MQRLPAASPSSALPSDRKSTRLNSSHLVISYAVFCLKKKKKAITNVFTSPAAIHPTASPPSTLHERDQSRRQMLVQSLYEGQSLLMLSDARRPPPANL